MNKCYLLLTKEVPNPLKMYYIILCKICIFHCFERLWQIDWSDNISLTWGMPKRRRGFKLIVNS
jgi:hypothetical protein